MRRLLSGIIYVAIFYNNVKEYYYLYVCSFNLLLSVVVFSQYSINKMHLCIYVFCV